MQTLFFDITIREIMKIIQRGRISVRHRYEHENQQKSKCKLELNGADAMLWRNIQIPEVIRRLYNGIW